MSVRTSVDTLCELHAHLFKMSLCPTLLPTDPVAVQYLFELDRLLNSADIAPQLLERFCEETVCSLCSLFFFCHFSVSCPFFLLVRVLFVHSCSRFLFTHQQFLEWHSCCGRSR